jgi:predicted esterase
MSVDRAVLAAILSFAPIGLDGQEVVGRGMSLDTLWHSASAYASVIVDLPKDFDSTQAYPAVVALHGFGGSYDSFRRIAPALTEAGFIVVFPEAPYSYLADGQRRYSWGLNTWTPVPLTADPELDFQTLALTVEEFIPSALARVRAEYDVSRAYVLGYSQGAIYGFLTAFYNSSDFSGIVAFALAGFTRDWATVRGGELEDGNHIPVFLGHGDADSRAPFAEAQRARDLLSEAGYQVRLHGFVGGHEVPSEALAEAVDWLVAVHSKGGSP